MLKRCLLTLALKVNDGTPELCITTVILLLMYFIILFDGFLACSVSYIIQCILNFIHPLETQCMTGNMFTFFKQQMCLKHSGEDCWFEMPLCLVSDFKSNFRAAPIRSVDVYNLMCKIAGIPPLPNNGSWSRVACMLKDNANLALSFQWSSSVLGLILFSLFV